MRLILVAVGLLAALLAGGAALLLFARDKAPDSLVQAELAGARFVFARAYARDEASAAGGLADRLNFLVSFPAFAPVKDHASPKAVTLSVTPRDETLDPAERPAKLYARFLTAETREGPGNLILRRFEQGSPYDLEELYLAPPDGQSFFARCPRSRRGGPGETCLSMFRDGAFDVELRYPAAYLEHWDALYPGARALLRKMTASSVSRKKTR
jgi:hypothetical protein